MGDLWRIDLDEGAPRPAPMTKREAEQFMRWMREHFGRRAQPQNSTTEER